MAEFTIKEYTYRSRKLDAFAQMHVVRRIAPIITSLKAMFEQGLRPDDQADADFFDTLGPLVDAVSALPDADVNYVVATCLAVVDRQSGPGWQTVWNSAAGRAQFEDIQTNMMLMLHLCYMVIQDSVSNFLSELPTELKDGGKKLRPSKRST